MDFTNEFSVDAPLSKVWDFMLRADDVAPCVPGAAITEEIDASHYRGTVKLKLGAVQMIYRGELEMVPDEAGRTITLQARGTDTRGGGGASGQFVTTLTDRDGGGTHVHIESHLDITGRVATFGRGIMQDVSNRLMKEFAACLESKLQSPAPIETSSEPATVDTAPDSLQPQEIIHSDIAHPPAASESIAPELKLGRLVADLARGRVAAGLRGLAKLIEPK